MSSTHPISELNDSEFDALIDGHIERTAIGYGDLPASLFFDLLIERIEARSSAPVTLQVKVFGDQLVITPDREDVDVLVRGSEVLMGGRRLILRLAEQSG